MTNTDTQKLRQLELLWWALTLFVVLLILTPIYLAVTNFPFYLLNAIYITTFITVARYIFLLKYTFLAKSERWKIICVFLCIPAVFLLVQELNLFQTFLDENGMEAMVGNILPLSRRTAINKYIYNEIMLFGVGSIISCVLLPFRLLISVWRGRNNAGI